MTSFDEYRKKLNSKYGNSTKSSSTEDEKNVKNGNANTSPYIISKSSIAGTSFEAYRDQLNAKYRTDKIDARGVDKWFQDADIAMDSMDRYYQSNNGSYAEGFGGNEDVRIANLLNSSADVYHYLLNHKDEFENFDALDAMFSSYRTALRQYDMQNYYIKQHNLRQAGYQQTYQGKTYDEIQSILQNMENGEEKDWLTAYSQSSEVMTPDVYQRLISEKQAEISALEEAIYVYRARDNYTDSAAQAQYENDMAALRQAEQELAKLQEGKWYADNSAKYGAIPQNADFAAQSKVAEDKPTLKFGIQLGNNFLGVGDPVYDYINDIDGTREKVEYLADGNASNAALHKYNFMDDPEVATYNYIYNTEGKKAANEYLEYLTYELNARQQRQLAKDNAEFATKHPFWASAASVPNHLLSGAGLLDVAWQNAVKGIKEGVTGEYSKPINYNTDSMSPNTRSTTIRETVSQNIVDKTGSIQLDSEKLPILSSILNGKSFGDVYQLGMSMADSAVVALLSRWIGNFGTVLLGGAAGTQGMLEAVERGATDKQALSMGILNGVFEWLFEKIPLDNLLSMIKKGETGSFIKSVLRQALTEGGEEFGTSVANTVADIVIMAEKSDWNTLVEQYMVDNPNMSEAEASLQALRDTAVSIGWDFVGGVISGFGFGGAASAVQNVQQNAAASKTYGDSAGDLVGEALELNPDSRFANRMQGRLDDGKTLSGGQLNRLVQQNEKAITQQDVATIEQAAISRLQELGETGDVEAIAAAIAKQAAGKKLTRTEQQTIANSKYGTRLSNELNPENIQSGEYSSGWAQRLDTNRINAESYSSLVEAAQMPQDGTEAAEWKDIGQRLNAAQRAETAREKAPAETVWENRTVADRATTEEAVEELADVDPDALRVSDDGKTILQESGKEVEIQSIASVYNGELTLRLKDGSTVSDKQIAYGSEGEALLYEAVASLGADVEISNILVNNYLKNDGGVAAGDYALGMVEAFRYGTHNFPRSELDSNAFAAKLTDVQRNSAYMLGERFGGKQTGSENAQARRARLAKKFTETTGDKKTSSKKGEVHFEGDRSSLTERQKVSLTALGKVAKALGIQIYVFESDVDENGRRIGANGWYDPKDGSIHIDLHAGTSGEATMLFTLAHELTHFIKQWSPAKFKVLANFLMKQYGQKGVSVDALVRAQLDKAKQHGRTISYDTAYEEVIADSMETMLSDGKVLEKLAELKQIDKTLWEKIRDFISELAEKIREVYAGLSPDSMEGRYVAEMKDSIETIQNLFTEGLVEASENYQAAEKNTTEDGGERRFSFKGTNKDGIEVYETSEYVKSLSWQERKKLFLQLMRNQYRGKTAKFIRNGHAYYATFEYRDVSKNIYGDTESDPKGRDAKVNVGADGNIFELVEHSEYFLSEAERGKTQRMHRGVKYWDYFIKTVQIDGEIYDVLANIRKKDSGSFVYNIEMYQNKNIEPSLPEDSLESGRNRVPNDSKTSIRNDIAVVKNESAEALDIDVDENTESALADGQLLYSDRDSDSVSNRALLANALESTVKNDIERKRLEEYKDQIERINAEEQKLSSLNVQIRELSFAKGPKDTKAIRDLQLQAQQTANRINTYDRQLLRLEASQPLQNVLEREKKTAYKKAEQKGKEALDAYRERAAKAQREIINRYQESRRRGVEGREKTAMRRKIKNVVNELNQYLLKGNKDKRVMIPLKKAVAEALDAVNMDTVGAEERIARLQDELMKAKTPEQIQEISRKIDHIREMGDRMSGRLKALKDAYREIADSDDPLIANSHDDVIEAKMESVIEAVGNTPLRDMTLAQLNEVYDMYRMVLTTIRNANKAFKAKKSEDISELSAHVIDELDKSGKKKAYRLKGMEAIENFDWNNLKPVYAFERIGSGTLTELFNNVRSGEDVWAKDVTEAREYYLERSKQYGYDSWDMDKRYQFTSTSGMDFELTLPQIMSLYAYSKRAQAADHLRRGGIVFDKATEVTLKTKLGIKAKFNPTEATAYNLSDETLRDIISKLTDEQKGFVDEMQKYLSDTMGAKGNEVSLELYGIKLFNEKFYFPLKSATQYMAKAKEQQQGEAKIKNSAFSKETVQKASNPIVLTPFMDVWAGHVNEMSMYHAFVLPMEDFYRVYNYRTPTSETMATESVQQHIQNAHNSEAPINYIDQLLKDLNGGARSDPRESFSKALMSKFKKAAVMASMSVVVQQPTALIRAMALVDAKHFGIAPISRGIVRTVNAKKHRNLWNEVKQYAPVAIIKEMGYFDTNMGMSTKDFITAKEYSGIRQKAKALFTDRNYRDEKISRLPALADEMAWVAIWEAVKRETLHQHKNLSTKSEEFLKIVGERFTEVITKTQVYDSVLARSGNMRSKTAFMNMWTAFMAEPTTSINMIQDALRKAKTNKRYAARAIGAVYGSVILNAALVSVIYAMRDDDEDETFTEKYLSRLTTEIIDGINPLTYIPFLKDVWSIMQGFDIERADMSLITALVDAAQKAVKVIAEDTNEMDDEELTAHQAKVREGLWGLADTIAALTGIPLKNVRRDIVGVKNLFETIMKDADGRKTTAGSLMDSILGEVKASVPVWGWLPNESKANKLYDAIISGDTAYVDRLRSGYESEESYNSAIRKALRENDSRIREAAIAWNAGDLDEYMRIAREIIGEKHFTQDNVVMAIRSEASKLAPDESEPSASKAKGLFTTESFATAIVQGDSGLASAIRDDVIQTAQKNGKTAEEAAKSFNSSARNDLKEMFIAGELTETKAIQALANYCGDTLEEADERIDGWKFEKEHGFTYSDRANAYKSGDISAEELLSILMDVGGKTEKEARLQIKVYDWQKEGFDLDSNQTTIIENYEAYCAPVGVDKVTYYDFYQFYNDSGETGVAYSKTKECMPYIHSLPLSPAQKNAIALSIWSEETVNKYKLW